MTLKEMISSSHLHVYASCPPTVRWRMCFHTRASGQLTSCVSFLSELWVGVCAPQTPERKCGSHSIQKRGDKERDPRGQWRGGAQGHQADERRDPRRPDTEGCHHHGVSRRTLFLSSRNHSTMLPLNRKARPGRGKSVWGSGIGLRREQGQASAEANQETVPVQSSQPGKREGVPGRGLQEHTIWKSAQKGSWKVWEELVTGEKTRLNEKARRLLTLGNGEEGRKLARTVMPGEDVAVVQTVGWLPVGGPAQTLSTKYTGAKGGAAEGTAD